jgi:hypothetical protein
VKCGNVALGLGALTPMVAMFVKKSGDIATPALNGSALFGWSSIPFTPDSWAPPDPLTPRMNWRKLGAAPKQLSLRVNVPTATSWAFELARLTLRLIADGPAGP